MEDKRKVYLLLIILVLFVGLVFVIFEKSGKEEMSVQTPKQTSEQAIQVEKEKIEEKKEETVFPEAVNGIVIRLSDKSWTIDQLGKITEVGFKIETPVFKGSKETKATIFDVKAGTKLEATLNQDTGEVMEAVIGE